MFFLQSTQTKLAWATLFEEVRSTYLRFFRGVCAKGGYIHTYSLTPRQPEKDLPRRASPADRHSKVGTNVCMLIFEYSVPISAPMFECMLMFEWMFKHWHVQTLVANLWMGIADKLVTKRSQSWWGMLDFVEDLRYDVVSQHLSYWVSLCLGFGGYLCLCSFFYQWRDP